MLFPLIGVVLEVEVFLLDRLLKEQRDGDKRGRSAAVAAIRVNSGDTRKEEIWTAYESDS